MNVMELMAQLPEMAEKAQTMFAEMATLFTQVRAEQAAIRAELMAINQTLARIEAHLTGGDSWGPDSEIAEDILNAAPVYNTDLATGEPTSKRIVIPGAMEKMLRERAQMGLENDR